MPAVDYKEGEFFIIEVVQLPPVNLLTDHLALHFAAVLKIQHELLYTSHGLSDPDGGSVDMFALFWVHVSLCEMRVGS